MRSQTKTIPRQYSPTDEYISPDTLSLYKKRFPKYIHSLQIAKPINKTFGLSYLRYVKRTKQVQSLELYQESFHYQKPKYQENLALIKALKKSLRCLSGIPGLHGKHSKYLPELAQMDLDMAKPEPYKALCFYQRLKHFTFHIDTSSYRQIPILEKQINKNKKRLERYFGRLRNLESIEIKTVADDLEPFLKVMRLLEAFPKLIPSLKGFILRIQCGSVYSFPQKIPISALDSFSSLALVTSLSVEKFYSMMPIFRIENMRNLRELNLDIHSLCTTHRGTNNLDYLSNLRDLGQLRSLTISVDSNMKMIERMFFDHFSLPASLESVDLKIRGFIWKECEMTKKNSKVIIESIREHDRYKKFYNQWENLKQLKHLQLGVEDKKQRNGEIAGVFAEMILKQTQGLESVKFRYSGSEIKENDTNLDLKELIEALENSKKTLKTLEISAKNINFVQDICSNDFPTLENFEVIGKVVASPNTAKFLKSLSTRKEPKIQVKLDSLVVSNLKTFETLLESLNGLPKCVKIDLCLDLLELEKKVWWEIFCAEIEKLTFKGQISLTVENVFIRNMEVLRNMKTVVLGNPIFEKLLLKSKFKHVSRMIKRDLVYMQIEKNVIKEDVDPEKISKIHYIVDDADPEHILKNRYLLDNDNL